MREFPQVFPSRDVVLYGLKMNVQRIEQIVQAEMAGFRSDTREPGWILYQGQRTGKLAVLLAQKLNCEVDCDVLYTAGLFHDIGKGNDSHNEGAKLAGFAPSGQMHFCTISIEHRNSSGVPENQCNIICYVDYALSQCNCL